jgi:hypothetical protein
MRWAILALTLAAPLAAQERPFGTLREQAVQKQLAAPASRAGRASPHA